MKLDFTTYSRQFRLLALQNKWSDEDIDNSLQYAKKLADKDLPIIYDQEHLSLLMGIEYSYLLGVSNSQSKYYKQYLLPKKSAGYRVIMEPYPTLKLAQTWILKNILYANDDLVASNAKAFVRKVGLRDNAKFHKSKKVLLNIDLVDFFGSIDFSMVLELFTRLGYNKQCSVMLSNLCTLGSILPQGAPTSPMISNMIFYPVDTIIFEYCRQRKIMYTRYADDLSFSGDFDAYEMLRFLNEILKKFHFRINGKKTKICYSGNRQAVTNIVVNEKIQTRKDYRKVIRQNIYYIRRFGLESHLSTVNAKNGTLWKPESYLNHLRGKVGFALYVNPKDVEMQNYRQYLFELSRLILSQPTNDQNDT
ncbi:MAG: reverse transcriptase family protein [Muribaculum sp.]|nr:reverse transcriptase family protein [Muribaculum sp.]